MSICTKRVSGESVRERGREGGRERESSLGTKLHRRARVAPHYLHESQGASRTVNGSLLTVCVGVSVCVCVCICVCVFMRAYTHV